MPISKFGYFLILCFLFSIVAIFVLMAIDEKLDLDKRGVRIAVYASIALLVISCLNIFGFMTTDVLKIAISESKAETLVLSAEINSSTIEGEYCVINTETNEGYQIVKIPLQECVFIESIGSYRMEKYSTSKITEAKLFFFLPDAHINTGEQFKIYVPFDCENGEFENINEQQK